MGFPAARRATRSAGADWATIVDFTNTFDYGLIRTLQVLPELIAVLEKVERYCPKTVLEIGTAKGGTFFLLSRAASPNGLLISLDLPGGDFGGELVKIPWLREWVLPRMALPGQSLHFVRGDSHRKETLEAVKHVLKGRSIDVLFIDGDHSYEGVKQDFEMYSPSITSGGMVIFHDIAEHDPSSGCEVRRFWQEVRSGYRHEEIITDSDQGWAGFGILHF